MRTTILAFTTLAVLALAPSAVAGQAAADTVALEGCLAQEEDDDGVEYVLEHVDTEAATAAEIELMPVEGVDLAPHVGHTVGVTGTAQPGEEGEGEIHIRVTELRHIAASCEEG